MCRSGADRNANHEVYCPVDLYEQRSGAQRARRTEDGTVSSHQHYQFGSTGRAGGGRAGLFSSVFTLHTASFVALAWTRCEGVTTGIGFRAAAPAATSTTSPLASIRKRRRAAPGAAVAAASAATAGAWGFTPARPNSHAQTFPSFEAREACGGSACPAFNETIRKRDWLSVSETGGGVARAAHDRADKEAESVVVEDEAPVAELDL